MATLTLSKIFVNLIDTGEAVSGNSDPSRTQQHDMDGEVRTYAGGRQRSITREGVRGSFGFTLLQLTKANVDTLTSWIGQTVQVRDHRGQRFHGVYYAIAVGEYLHPARWKASIELRLVSESDGGV